MCYVQTTEKARQLIADRYRKIYIMLNKPKIEEFQELLASQEEKNRKVELITKQFEHSFMSLCVYV
jgi:hypothetical protein